MTPIAPLMTSFLREHMPIEQGYSPHTCETYAHAFRLLFLFASERLRMRPSQLQPRAPRRARWCSTSSPISRNNAATVPPPATRGSPPSRRSCDTSNSAFPPPWRRRGRSTPSLSKRHNQALVRHLTMGEVRAILDTPNVTTRLGIRDRAMLHLCFAGGLRVSELVGVPLTNLSLQRPPSIRVQGKGRSERCLPLWKETAADLRAWLAVRGAVAAPELFVNADGQAMTRAGFEYILGKHTRTAAETCLTLKGRSVSPHQLRHSCAIIDAPGHSRHPQSRTLARPRRYSHDRNLLARGSLGEARGHGDGLATGLASWTLQGTRRADRVAASVGIMRSPAPLECRQHPASSAIALHNIAHRIIRDGAEDVQSAACRRASWRRCPRRG